jgi:hypothetical protein
MTSSQYLARRCPLPKQRSSWPNARTSERKGEWFIDICTGSSQSKQSSIDQGLGHVQYGFVRANYFVSLSLSVKSGMDQRFDIVHRDHRRQASPAITMSILMDGRRGAVNLFWINGYVMAEGSCNSKIRRVIKVYFLEEALQ